MIAVLALIGGGKAIFYDTLDPDSFWHLRVAEQLQQDGIGPIVDHLSFASIKTPWTPYSWLAELGMKVLWDAGGYRAAILAQALMMAGFIVFTALGASELARRTHPEDGNPLAVIIATVFAMYLTLPFLSFRPATFAFMMLALCAWLLLRDRRLEERTRAVWFVVPLVLLVTNCHFFAILVPLWVGALLAGSILERDRRGTMRYLWMLIATVIACAGTPMLTGALHSIWNYQSADPMIGSGIIAELRPIWTSAITVTIVLIWLGVIYHNRGKLRAGEWIWMLGAMAMYIRIARMSPAFAPIAAATLAGALPHLGGRVLARPAIRITLASILVVGMIRLSTVFPDSQMPLSRWLNRHGPDTPGFPTDAADYVAQQVHPVSGRIINEFSWGGYLSWRLGDQYQILLDGRTQLYSPQFWQAMYLDSSGSQAREALKESHADAAVVPSQRSRFRDILTQLGWQSVYRDDRAEVLLPPAPVLGRTE